MSKKTKKEKKPAFPQSVAIRWDDSGSYSDTSSEKPLMLAEALPEDHVDLSGPITVGVYELKKIMRVEATSTITIITHDAREK